MKRLIHFLVCLFLMLAVHTADWAQKPELVVQAGHSSPIESIVSSPDGKVLASVDRDGLVIIWDVSTGRELRAFSVPSSWSGSVAFSADSKTIAYGYSLGIHLWDILSGREVRYFEGASTSVSFSSNGEGIISVNTEGEVIVWNIESGKKRVIQEGLCYVSGGTGAAPIYVQYSLAVTPDGKTTAVLTCEPAEYGLVLLEIETGHRLQSFEYSSDDKYAPIRYGALAFSRDGKMLIGSRESHPSRVFLRQERDGHMERTLEVDPGRVPNTTSVWSVATGDEYASFPGTSPRLSQDGRSLTTQDKGTISLWDLASRKIIRTFPGQAAAFLFDQKTIAVGDRNSIALFEIASGNKVKGFAPAGATSVSAIDVSPDSQMIVIGTNKSIKLWKLMSDRGLISLERFDNNSDSDENSSITEDSELANLNSKPFLSVSFSPGNRVIAAAHNKYVKGQEGFDVQSTVVLWDQAFGKMRKRIPVDTSGLIEYFVPEVRSVKFSPNGRLVATLQGDKSIKLLDLYSHKTIRVAPIEGFTPMADRINTMLFSPDGRVLGYGDGWGVALVDTKTGRKKYLGGDPMKMDAAETKENGTDFLGLTLSIVFSPDGKIIGGAFSKHYQEEWVGDDRDVGFYKFWNVSTGREIKFFNLPAWANFQYKLSKPASINGRKVRVVVERNQIKLIDLRTKRSNSHTSSIR